MNGDDDIAIAIANAIANANAGEEEEMNDLMIHPYEVLLLNQRKKIFHYPKSFPLPNNYSPLYPHRKDHHMCTLHQHPSPQTGDNGNCYAFPQYSNSVRLVFGEEDYIGRREEEGVEYKYYQNCQEHNQDVAVISVAHNGIQSLKQANTKRVIRF